MNRWVLLVEDSADDRDLVLHAWRRLGIAARLEVVRDGGSAIRRLDDEHSSTLSPPLVVLLDLKMTGVDGFQVLEHLRSRRGRSRPPVVVLTSSDEPRDISRSYALGASGFVVKPVSSDQFMAMVAAIGTFWTEVNVPAPQESRHGLQTADTDR